MEDKDKELRDDTRPSSQISSFSVIPKEAIDLIDLTEDDKNETIESLSDILKEIYLKTESPLDNETKEQKVSNTLLDNPVSVWTDMSKSESKCSVSSVISDASTDLPPSISQVASQSVSPTKFVESTVISADLPSTVKPHLFGTSINLENSASSSNSGKAISYGRESISVSNEKQFEKMEVITSLFKFYHKEGKHREAKNKSYAISDTTIRKEINSFNSSILKWFKDDDFIVHSVYDETLDCNVDPSSNVEHKHKYAIVLGDPIQVQAQIKQSPKFVNITLYLNSVLSSTNDFPSTFNIQQAVSFVDERDLTIKKITKYGGSDSGTISKCSQIDKIEDGCIYKITVEEIEEGVVEAEVKENKIIDLEEAPKVYPQHSQTKNSQNSVSNFDVYEKSREEIEKTYSQDKETKHYRISTTGYTCYNKKHEESYKTKPKVAEKPKPKFTEIDDSKSISRSPLGQQFQIGCLYDEKIEEFVGEAFDNEEVEKFTNSSGAAKPKVEIEVFRDDPTFQARCKRLGLHGIQQIKAFINQTGPDSYLIFPTRENYTYFTVLIKCAGKIEKLKLSDESMREKLATAQFGNATHLLTAINYGKTIVFMIGYPTKTSAFNSTFEQALKNSFNNYNRNQCNKSPQIPEGIQVKMFDDQVSDVEYKFAEEFVKSIKKNPDEFLMANSQWAWKLTPLNQFQPEFSANEGKINEFTCKFNLAKNLPYSTFDNLITLINEVKDCVGYMLSNRDNLIKYERIFTENEREKLGAMFNRREELLKNCIEAAKNVFQFRCDDLELSDVQEQLKTIEKQMESEQVDENFKFLSTIDHKIKEVVEWEAEGLEFVGSDNEIYLNAIRSPVCHLLVFANRKDLEFVDNLKYLKTLPSNQKRLLLVNKLLELPGLTETTQILRYENGELIEENVLAAYRARRNSSVVRYIGKEKRVNCSIGAKVCALEIPCPTCKEADCFWICSDCFQPMEYDFHGFYSCQCGLGHFSKFEYWCKNYNKHGEDYVEYPKVELDKQLNFLRSFNDRVILILGQSGVGKSTWINSIAHYLTYETLEDALNGDPVYLVPSSFTIYDENYEAHNITVGEESTEEQFGVGKSATKSPKVHSFDFKGGKLLFIDTPGVGDVDGTCVDEQNFKLMLDCIRNYKELHGICVLMKPNESRMNAVMKYCINGLLTHLHKSAASNIVFCFTNTQGTLYKPGETLTWLRKYLDDLRNQRNGVDIKLNNDTIYCMDNCVFRYLCAYREGYTYDEKTHATYVEAWNKSYSETHRLIKRICGLKAHSSSDTTTLNKARHLILSLAKPLAVITSLIQTNVNNVEEHRAKVNQLSGNEANFANQIKIRRTVVSSRKLPYPRTVCINEGCVSVKKDQEGRNVQLFHRYCHEHCYLSGVTEETYPNPALKNCWAMSNGENCHQCTHNWSQHMHVTWEHEEKQVDYEDPEILNTLTSTSNKKKAKQDTIRKCEEMIVVYKNEQQQINRTAARFAAFLKENSIILHNDAIREYIQVEINNAKIEATYTGNTTKVGRLEQALKDYQKERDIIERHVSASQNTYRTPAEVAQSLIDFQSQFDALVSMPYTGQQIKEMLECSLQGQNDQVQHSESHYDKHAQRMKGKKKFINKKSNNKQNSSNNNSNDKPSSSGFLSNTFRGLCSRFS